MLNILIVDDDRIMCDCLLYMLEWERLGCSVPKVAHNGLEAWKLLQEEKIDLVIADWKMPVIDGLELSRRIYEEKLNTRIILLTAHEDFRAAKLCIRYGIEDYILKPINEESLSGIRKIVISVGEGKTREKIQERFYDEEYGNRIQEAVSDQDREFLQEMFSDMYLLDARQVVAAGMALLNLLYGYLCKKDRTRAHSVYEPMLKKWRRELLELEDADSQIGYVRRQYQSEVERSNDETEIEKTVRHIRQIVAENYHRPDCNVSWIAEKLYMTPSYVGKIFAKNMGVGLMEYIIDYRMEMACRMLVEEYIPINTVAVRVGYLDVNYFAKAFKNKMKVTPSRYRREGDRDVEADIRTTDEKDEPQR